MTIDPGDLLDALCRAFATAVADGRFEAAEALATVAVCITELQEAR